MIYLDAEYRLAQVSDIEYSSSVRSVATSNQLNGVAKTLRMALVNEDPELARIIEGVAHTLHEIYGKGGGTYMLASASSIMVLRSKNPSTPQIRPVDWDRVIDREQELRSRPAVRTVELISGLGLAEVRNVNAGYVDGFQANFQRPAFLQITGIVGLAALHAHDLMHFASLA